MAGHSKRKSLNTSQSRTLHHFFGPNGVQSGKNTPNVSKGKGKQKTLSLPHEIIVIESDDDDEYIAKSKRRGRDVLSHDGKLGAAKTAIQTNNHKSTVAAGASGEHGGRKRTISPEKRRQDETPAKRSKLLSRSPSIEFVEDSAPLHPPSLRQAVECESVDYSPFGIPTTLLRPPSPSTRAPIFKGHKPDSSFSPFAIPTTLIRPQSPCSRADNILSGRLDPSLTSCNNADSCSPFGVPTTLMRPSSPFSRADSILSGRANPTAPSSLNVDSCSPFGIPNTLLRSRSPCPKAESSSSGQTSITGVTYKSLNYQTFAAQAGGLGESTDWMNVYTAPAAVLPEIKSQQAEGSSASSSNVNINMDIFDDTIAEWGVSDDETALFDRDQEEEEQDEENEEVACSRIKMVDVCPVCSERLTSDTLSEIQDHINKCIDSSHSRRSATPISTPLRPLSSFRTPHQNEESNGEHKVTDAKRKGNAFSVLMSSHEENEAWKEAAVAEDQNFRPTKGNGGRRKAPFYKVLQGMPIAVDAFRYGTIPGVKAYFLTHAHSDHYTNLSSNWKSGYIYCSEGTANLIIHMLNVDPKWVHAIPLDVATILPGTGGVRVTPIEANHCPGSCLFLFEGPQTVDAGDSAYKSSFVGSSRIFRYLHCGDFRASPQHVLHPAVKGKKIDHVYLDTTYLDPKYCFPPQPLVISACAELAKRIVSGKPVSNRNGTDSGMKNQTVDRWLTTQEKPQQPPKDKTVGKVLVVVGTYSIGKERIVKAIAQVLDSKIYCDKRKAAILRCQNDPELHALLTSDPFEAVVHIVPLSVITSDRLKEYVERFKGHFSKTVGFRPTGWTYTAPNGTDTIPSLTSLITRTQQRQFTCANLSPMRNSTPALQLYGVPYSEHSSFFELTCFALSFQWGKMIATVNVGSERSRGRMGRWVETWEKERKARSADGLVPFRRYDYW